MAGASAMSTIASTTLISGCSLKISDRSSLKCRSMNLFVNPTGSKKAAVAANGRISTCQAILSGDNGRPSSTSLLIGGFLLGGIVIGSLGCIYAPQIIRAFDEPDRKDIMAKMPKFLYDEDKVLARTRKEFTDKIEQLNAAIDGVISRLREDGGGASMESGEIEAVL